ncbi:MAG: selenide, water dikinase SelD, partial [Defluviitaleaceae bacterium]|nr:selenide, water dikinase SelD [Defluviitaleaceae bacterium]
VGFDNSDDGAVFRISDEIAVIQTLDFFAPMVDNPYIFGEIAAANALSDIYAMGGDVSVALNIAAFPTNADPAVLSAILRGGAAKVNEAGGVLCGGHTIVDKDIKYGLSVMGIVHPDKIIRNNTCRIGDKIILTKALGVGIAVAAYNAGAAGKSIFDTAVESMTTLNRAAFEAARKYRISAQTDVTGFGFLGHLSEMIPDCCDEDYKYSILVESDKIPIIPETIELAAEFLTTAGGANNRRFFADNIDSLDISEPLLEIMYDPQTSGGLMIAVHPDDSDILLKELQLLGLPSAIVGTVIKKEIKNILIV